MALRLLVMDRQLPRSVKASVVVAPFFFYHRFLSSSVCLSAVSVVVRLNILLCV